MEFCENSIEYLWNFVIKYMRGVKYMKRLRRKIDQYLLEWKNSKDKMPLIVKGARQIGKTDAIENFAKNNYKSVVEINFALQKQYRDIFDDGYEVDTILRKISLRNTSFEFIPGETLIFFDELQDCINCATSLKAFNKVLITTLKCIKNH